MSETKIYWQAMDANGNEYTYRDQKPDLICGAYRNPGHYTKAIFPITLKPLQLAKITITPDGKWHAEIEREEGYYMANKKPDLGRGIVQYKGGKWFDIDGAPLVLSLEPYTISPNRIPDECII